MSTSTIVFAGDSVTDCGRMSTADGLGDGYVRELAGRPELAGWRVVNAGVSGNRVKDLAARWREDVLSARPDVVSVFIGINEVWRRFDENDPTSDAAYEAGLRALLETLDGVRVVLVEPVLLPKDEEQRGWAQEHAGKIAVVHALAQEFGATLVPMNAELNAAGDAAGYAPDGVHPNAAGHRLLADVWLRYAGAALRS